MAYQDDWLCLAVIGCVVLSIRVGSNFVVPATDLICYVLGRALTALRPRRLAPPPSSVSPLVRPCSSLFLILWLLLPCFRRQHQQQTTKEGGVALSGYLMKRSTNVRKDWKRRWFVVKKGQLFYMRSPDDLAAASPVDLTLATVRIPTGKDVKVRFCFEVVTMPPRGQPRSLTLQVQCCRLQDIAVGVGDSTTLLSPFAAS